MAKYNTFSELDKAVRRTANGYHKEISQWLSAKRNESGGYDLMVNRTLLLGTVRRDDTLEFAASHWGIEQVMRTLRSIKTYLPVTFYIQGEGRSPVALLGVDQWQMNGHEYFPGMKINLLTGECMNPPTFYVADAVPEVKAEFDSKLSSFLDGIAHRQRIGVFDSLDVDVHSMPVWMDLSTLDRFVYCIRRQDWPMTALRDIKESSGTELRYIKDSSGTGGDIKSCANILLSKLYRVPLKRLYGCFGPEVIHEYRQILARVQHETCGK